MKKITDKARREQVSFDAFYFEKMAAQGQRYPMKEAFDHIRNINLWGADESLSGEGSTDRQTHQLIGHIRQLLKDYKIHTVLDAPCGDFGWLSVLAPEFDTYIGMDIIKDFINQHQKKYAGAPNLQFILGDLTQTKLPKADLILCRDCLVHFSNADIHAALKNFKQSGSKYLLTTTFTDCDENTDIITGDWRLLNFERPPFNFPAPETTLVEGCIESGSLYKDKSLGLWDLSHLNI